MERSRSLQVYFQTLHHLFPTRLLSSRHLPPALRQQILLQSRKGLLTGGISCTCTRERRTDRSSRPKWPARRHSSRHWATLFNDSSFLGLPLLSLRLIACHTYVACFVIYGIGSAHAKVASTRKWRQYLALIPTIFTCFADNADT